ncbi:MAG: beta-lactamase family protein [Clostridia bacterium]|nr:beta-lactamase family protein [Clostridia bacterium]
MEVKEKLRLERADYPEQVGVSSKKVEELIRDFKDSNIELHSLMIIRHDKVAYESWAAPYSSETSHMVYSVSKSFTSTAVGFAIEEGLMTLDTRVVDIFPEYRNEEDKNLEKLNVHHLLSMQSGKSVSVFSDKSKNRWLEDFINAPWGFAPGDGHWEYVSENQYVLCAMLCRVTGMSVIEYLTPRLFEPLGIDVPFWEHDINGVEAGGWGLFLKTEDIARFMFCYAHNGVYAGRQVIPANWVRLATKVQGNNSVKNDAPDGQSGYGYCFWRCGGVNGYRADGMFSQFGIVALDYDAILVMNAGEIDEQKSRDCIWRHFPDCLIEPDSEPTPEVKPEIAPLDDDLPALSHSYLEKEIEGRTIQFKKNLLLNTAGFPVSVLPFPVVYMSGYRAGNITDVSFEFNGDTCSFSWSEADEKNTVICGMDGTPRRTPMTLARMNFTAVATAAWISDTELEIHIRPVEAVCQRILKFTFDGDRVTFRPSSKQPIKAMSDNIAKDMDHYLPNIMPVQKAGLAVFDMLPKLVDSIHEGKFI